jgi:hypothetical protein
LQDLTSASVSQTGARLWTIEYKGYYSRAKFALPICRDTHKWALTGQRGRSQSIVLAYRRLLMDWWGKGNSKAIIAWFDIGVVLPVHGERGGAQGLGKRST